MKTVVERYKVISENAYVEVPHHVWALIGDQAKQISIYGDQVSLGEDFGSLEQCRAAIQWYVEQLGGKVKWSKEDR